jgi:hypothetical protein
MAILSIDPGNVESAYCLIEEETYKPIEFGKIDNTLLLIKLGELNYDKLIIEMIASYGMPVGASVFETCVWIGRFIQRRKCPDFEYIYRKEEKMNLCYSMKAKDSNIRQALIDRFGEVGTKKNQGFFYGFKKDIWAAFAVGVTYLDKQKRV